MSSQLHPSTPDSNGSQDSTTEEITGITLEGSSGLISKAIVGNKLGFNNAKFADNSDDTTIISIYEMIEEVEQSQTIYSITYNNIDIALPEEYTVIGTTSNGIEVICENTGTDSNTGSTAYKYYWAQDDEIRVMLYDPTSNAIKTIDEIELFINNIYIEYRRPITVTMDNGPVAQVTYINMFNLDGEETLIPKSASVLSDDEGRSQVELFYNGQNYSTIFTYSTEQESTEGMTINSLGTTADDIEVSYGEVSIDGLTTYIYYWVQNGIYVSLESIVEYTLDDVDSFIYYTTLEVR